MSKSSGLEDVQEETENSISKSAILSNKLTQKSIKAEKSVKEKKMKKVSSTNTIDFVAAARKAGGDTDKV